MKHRRFVALLSAISAFAPMTAIAQRAVAHGDQGPLGDMNLVNCGQGVLDVLPGDYYFRAGYEAQHTGNTRKAVSMFESAAAWGDKRAMFNLGLILLRGDGITQDEPLGLAWLALSAERDKDQLQRQTLASAWKSASAETQDAATALWNSMKLKYADRVTLARAQNHYARRTSSFRGRFLADSIRIDGLCGPKTVAEVLQALDEIAGETILRPRTTLRGKVIVGDPTSVVSPTSESPDP